MSDRETSIANPRDEADDFLSRWARRKSAVRRDDDSLDDGKPLDEASTAPPDPGERIDARTGKRYDELTDDDMPPLDALDETSDLSMFMARNISSALRMEALGKIFRSPKYNQVCLCAEYAEDYTNFEPLGDIIPNDMKSAIAREADKLRRRLLAMDQDISPEEARARVLREMRGKSALPSPARESAPVAALDTEVTPSESDRRHPPPVADDPA
jgi:hypothetical protein